jgi:hypothetical protein
MSGDLLHWGQSGWLPVQGLNASEFQGTSDFGIVAAGAMVARHVFKFYFRLTPLCCVFHSIQVQSCLALGIARLIASIHFGRPSGVYC